MGKIVCDFPYYVCRSCRKCVIRVKDENGITIVECRNGSQCLSKGGELFHADQKQEPGRDLPANWNHEV